MNFSEFLKSYPVSEAIDDLRVVNSLYKAGIEFMGDLPISDEDLLSIRNIGIKQLDSIFEGYGRAGLDFHNME